LKLLAVRQTLGKTFLLGGSKKLIILIHNNYRLWPTEVRFNMAVKAYLIVE